MPLAMIFSLRFYFCVAFLLIFLHFSFLSVYFHRPDGYLQLYSNAHTSYSNIRLICEISFTHMPWQWMVVVWWRVRGNECAQTRNNFDHKIKFSYPWVSSVLMYSWRSVFGSYEQATRGTFTSVHIFTLELTYSLIQNEWEGEREMHVFIKRFFIWIAEVVNVLHNVMDLSSFMRCDGDG